jgi:hypothetical protein
MVIDETVRLTQRVIFEGITDPVTLVIKDNKEGI